MPVRSDTIKNIFWILLDVALVGLIVFGGFFANALWRYGHGVPPAKTITVSAQGKAAVVPDLATVNFSLIAEGTDPVKLQNDNTGKVNDVIDYIKSQGIDPKDIKTTGYNLTPKYTYNPRSGRSSIEGYILTQSVEIKIRDFSKISPILAALPGKGINDINGPQFSVEDPDKYLNQAREEAFGKARDKAQAIAGFAHVHLGSVVTFNESTGGYPPPIMYAALEKNAAPVPAPAPTIEPGSQEVTLQISVTYEIW